MLSKRLKQILIAAMAITICFGASVNSKAADTDGPQFAFTMATEGHGDGESYFCEPPQVVVSDEDGLESIVVDIKKIKYPIYSPDIGEDETQEVEITGDETSIDISSYLAGRKGDVTITASDKEGHETVETFRMYHDSVGMVNMQRSKYGATCTQASRTVTKYLCSFCDEVYWEFTTFYDERSSSYEAPLGHTYDEDQVQTVTDPCGEVSEPATFNICKRCGYVNVLSGSFNIEDPAHNWQHYETDASCTTSGTSYEKCETCGAIKDFKVTDQMKGHTWTKFEDSVEMDCKTNQPGKRSRHCTTCETEESYTIPVSHRWGSRRTVKEATCTEPEKLGFICQDCKTVSDESTWIDGKAATGHVYSDDYDCTTEVTCDVCSEQITAAKDHDMKLVGDADGHWEQCQNDGCTHNTKSTGYVSHTLPDDYDCTKPYTCQDCQTVVEPKADAKHVLEWKHNSTTHWQECQNCTYKTQPTGHTLTNDFDCTTGEECTECGYEIEAQATAHDYGTTYVHTEAGHYQSCQNPGCNVTTSVETHDAPNDYNCTTQDVCRTCGYVVRAAMESHSFAASPYFADGAEGHYQVCQNTGCSQRSSTVSHTGGSANCKDLAICEVCNEPYGKTNPQVHNGTTRIENERAATEEAEGYTGDTYCDGCNALLDQGTSIPKLEPSHKHSYKWMADSENHWQQCTECGKILDKEAHDFSDDFVSDGSGHWHVCTNENCKMAGAKTMHSAANEDYNCETALNCVCGYEIETAKGHNFTDHIYAENDKEHWYVCQNGNCVGTSEHEVHTAVDDDDCETELACECGRVLKAADTHEFSSTWIADANGHYQVCQNEGCKQEHREEHIPSSDDGNCATAILCTVCRYETSPAQEHSFTGSSYYSNGQGGHYQVCTNPGCEEKSEPVACEGGTATCKSLAICDVCHSGYGEVNPDNHVAGTVIKDYVEPTTEKEGYSGNERCLDCDAIITPGTVLNKLSPEHQHAFSNLEYDNEGSWYSCDCGTRDEASYKPHTYGNEVYCDETGHWRQCVECNMKGPVTPHTPEEEDYDCTTALTCSECDYVFVEASNGHVYDNDAFSYSDAEHWKVCLNDDCNVIGEKESHQFQDDGNCETPLACEDCGYVLTAAMQHNYSGDWNYDENGHWNSCSHDGCRSESNHEDHTGGSASCAQKAVCEVCGASYGEYDPSVHLGDVELWGYREATETEDGYTGDLYCLDCETIIEPGKPIPASGGQPHEHSFGDWESDSIHHWKSCSICGEKSKFGDHDGGKATCTDRASCDVCGTQYGEKDMNNHVGGTEVRDHKAATEKETGYTGDTYCLGCGSILEKGEVIPVITAEHVHSFSDWKSDGKHHWKECKECGAVSESADHKLLTQKNETEHWSVCEICGFESEHQKHTYSDGKCSVCGVTENTGSSKGNANSNSESTTESTAAPVKTGDNSNVAAWLIIMLISFGAALHITRKTFAEK